MATTIDSRIIYSDSNGTVGYELAYDLLNQSTANNSSTVRLYGILHVNMGSVYWSRGSASVHTSGLQTIGNSYSRGDYVVISRDFSFGHDANGNFSTYIGASLSTTFISADIGGTLTLPHIDRIAITNSVEGSDVEGNFKVNYTKYVDTYTYKLRISIPRVVALETINYNTSGETFTLSQESINEIFSRTANSPDNSIQLGFRVETWNGDSRLSEGNEVIITGRIVNANPIFSNFTFADINTTTTALTGNNQYCIRGYSNIQATISTANKAVAQKSATMVKYQFNCGTNTPVEVSYNDSTDVTLTMNNASIGTFTIYAIDSRTNTTPVTKLATQDIVYDKIYIDKQNSNIQRTNGGVGEGAILTLSGKLWKNSFGAVNNAINSVTYRFKKTDSSTWITGTTTITPTVDNDGNITFSDEIASDDTTWDLDASYNVQITISDKLSSDTIDLILNSAKPTMSLDRNGVGIMCAYDNNLGGLLQVGGKVIDGGKILWTNPNPTNNFSGTTITLSSDDYDVYEIIYSSEATGTLNNTLKSTKSIKGYGTIMEITNPSGSVTPIRARNVTYDTDTSLIISNGYTNNVYPLSTDNSKCIPLYVIGYNTGLFS